MISKSKFLKEILGKTITGIVIREGTGAGPHYQFFVIFADNTYLELYGNIDWSTHLESGNVETARQHAIRAGGTVVDIT
jgi:hypothetical protein